MTPRDPARCPRASTALNGRRIVIADDVALARTALSEPLAAAGARVLCAADGRDAVLAVVAGPCDLFITDLEMPGVDGLQAVAILRWDFGLMRLPVLVVATGAEAATAQLLEVGADACLVKPVAPAALLRVVEACLQGGLAAVPAAGRVPKRTAALFDPHEARGRLAGRQDLLRRLCRLFLARHADTPAAAARCLARNDRDTARRLAHALRGTAAQVGADPLRDAAARLEAALATGEVPGGAAGAAVEALAETSAATHAAIAAWLRRSDPAGN